MCMTYNKSFKPHYIVKPAGQHLLVFTIIYTLQIRKLRTREILKKFLVIKYRVSKWYIWYKTSRYQCCSNLSS